MYDMIKLGKRSVRDERCLGLLIGSYHQLKSTKTECMNFDKNCQRYDCQDPKESFNK